jgi:hypothetical protein
MAAGLGLLENRPLTDSPEKTPFLGGLCVSNESSLEDEWAVSLHVNYFLLLAIIAFLRGSNQREAISDGQAGLRSTKVAIPDGDESFFLQFC